SRDQSSFFTELDCLGAPSGPELVEQAAGVRFHRIFTYKQPFRYFPVAEPNGDQAKDLQFAWCDAQLVHALLVERKRCPRWRSLLNDDLRLRLFPGERESEPDAEDGEQCSHQATIYLQRVLHHQETVLCDLQQRYERSAAQAVEQNFP